MDRSAECPIGLSIALNLLVVRIHTATGAEIGDRAGQAVATVVVRARRPAARTPDDAGGGLRWAPPMGCGSSTGAAAYRQPRPSDEQATAGELAQRLAEQARIRREQAYNHALQVTF
eukprot:SAG31_NODE_2732_length_5173_cov_18.479306_1_plen_117_part_00